MCTNGLEGTTTLRSVSLDSYLLAAGEPSFPSSHPVCHRANTKLTFLCRDGHYGLYLDASLLDGSSAPCPTFANPVLCSRVDEGSLGSKKDVSFECVGLEVWGVGP